MKRVLLFVLLFTIYKITSAQNVQLHYDMGKDRKMLTTTVEMFKPDKIGSTFFFIDMDYGSKASGIDDLSLAYWEIARSFKISSKCAFEPRVEYNGGFGRGELTDEETIYPYHYSINSAYLVGGQYTWNNKDFSKVFTLQANYKYIKDKEDVSFQITGVWDCHFFNRKISFTGFADFWKEEQLLDGEKTDFIFLTEPQIWYNAFDKFSFGTEIEISNNFSQNKGTMVNPTVAAKWTF